MPDRAETKHYRKGASMREQARLFRNLGDNMTAEKWEKQAQAEENYEMGNQ